MLKYPFTPELLDALPEEMAELFRGLELTLLEEIASRLKAAGQLNEVTVQGIRALRAHGISLDEIEKAIRETTGISEQKLKELLDDVVERNQAYYSDLITLADVTRPETLVDVLTIDAIRRQTEDTFRNITRSMGFLVDAGRTMLPPAKAYQWALNSAELQIQSSAISYNQAIRNSVKELADSGLKTVEYESGHVDQIDVACRRAVMTAVGQINEQYNIQSLEYLETDLVEVSAHAGARNTGVGFQNHEAWQGRIYRWKKYTRQFPNASSGNYKDFEETCGLGDVQGIHGANCRHWYSPFIEGVMEPTYSEKQLEDLKADKHITEYEGKKYDRYAATQVQRRIETSIRHWKRRKAAATNKQDEQAATIRIRRLNEKYKEFTEAAELRSQIDRANVRYS